MWASLWYIFLLDDGSCNKSWCLQGNPGWFKQVLEQVMGKMLLINIPPWILIQLFLGFWPEPLLWLPWVMDYKLQNELEINSFLSKLLMIMDLYHKDRKVLHRDFSKSTSQTYKVTCIRIYIWNTKMSNSGTREMVHWLRRYTVFPEAWVHFHVPTQGGSQQPISPTPKPLVYFFFCIFKLFFIELYIFLAPLSVPPFNPLIYFYGIHRHITHMQRSTDRLIHINIFSKLEKCNLNVWVYWLIFFCFKCQGSPFFL